MTADLTEDTWLSRALARRAAEENGDRPTTGARFNSYIGSDTQE